MKHPLDTADLDYLKSIDSCTLANAIEPMNVRERDAGYVGGLIRSHFADLPRTVGFALTAKVRNRKGQPGDPSGFWDLWKQLQAVPNPTVLVFESTDQAPDRCAHFGEVMATFATRLGAIALATNGGVRDTDEVQAMGFQYFAPFATVSHGNSEVYDVGKPVAIGGEPIKTGDLLHGDKHGIVKIPRAELSKIRGHVDDVMNGEKRLMDYITSSDFTIAGAQALDGYVDSP